MANDQENIVYLDGKTVELQPAPINPKWIIEGAPVTRNFLLSRAKEGGSYTMLWDCTTGVFHWYYDLDETVYVLKGSVVVRDDRGVEHTLVPGDHMLFRAGSHAIWHVEDYVQKVAFLRTPVPRPLMAPLLAWRKFVKILTPMWTSAAIAITTKAAMHVPPEALDFPSEGIPF